MSGTQSPAEVRGADLVEETPQEAAAARKPWVNALVVAASVGLALFQLATAVFGELEALSQRPIHLAFVFVIGFIVARGRLPLPLRLLAATVGVVSTIYLVTISGDLASRMGRGTPLDLTMGVLCILATLALGWVAMGPALSIIASLFLAYQFFGFWLMGPFRLARFDLSRVVSYQYLTSEGLFGIPLGVMASFVYLFLLFASLLKVSGLGNLVMDLALGLAGRSSGGPAKVAVISSAATGTITGSVVANVVSTGSITIPLMRRTGMTPRFAGAVESVASTGGSFLPPVMGTAAFLMADMTGRGYGAVVMAATIPALLYYLCLYLQVHYYAQAKGMTGLPASEIPDWRAGLKGRWHLFAALGVLVYFLVIDRATPARSVLYAIGALVVLAQLRRGTRLNWRVYVDAMVDAGKMTVSATAGCALAGVIMGVVTQTGIGLTFANMAVKLAAGNEYLLLFYVALGATLLGMGGVATVAYLIPAMIVAPVLVKSGIDLMAAHLFCLYYAMLSYITPPVALGSFAASGISGASPLATSITSVRLGIVGFVLPFMFVKDPELLLQGDAPGIALTLAICVLGVFGFALAFEGWMRGRLTIVERAVALIGAVLVLIVPGDTPTTAGAVLVAALMAWRYVVSRRAPQPVRGF